MAPFQKEMCLSSSSSGARVIVAEDFDGDGDLDIAGVSENDSKIRYFRNDGGGVFTSASTLSVLGGRHIATADLNGDGLPDFIGASGDLLAYHIINLGFSTFGENRVLTGAPNYIREVVIGDVNNDGLQDIFYGTVWSDELGLLLQHPGGGFETPRIAPWDHNNPLPQALVDMNQDGQLDLLFSASLNHSVFWAEMTANGEFEALHTVGSGFYQAKDAIYLDLENDGDVDVVATATSGDGLTLFENSGSEVFVEHTDFLTADLYHDGLQAVDMNADGLVDVVTFESYADGINIFTNLGGSFEESLAIPVPSPFDFEVGDMNYDGHLDIVVSTSPAWDDPSTPRVQVWLNDGDGDFSIGPALPGVGDSGGFWLIELSDLDSDGFPDIILNPIQSGVSCNWMKNTGVGTFLLGEEIGPTYGNDEFVVVDMNGDSDLDMVSFNTEAIWFTENHLNPGCMDSGACNFDPSAAVDDGSCCFVDCGCTNSNALNFIASATCDDNSCEFQTGCTNVDASNYNSEALVEDGSCTFLVSGHVFDDLNENGIWNTNEYALAYRNVQVPALGINLITNDEGQFQANLPPGAFEIYVAFDPNLPYNTTLNPVVVVVDDDPQTGIVFGISKEMPLFGICVDLYPSAGGLCDAPRNFNICYRNMSNLPIDGIIQLHPDPLFQGFVPVNEVDSVVENTIYLSFENLNPGQMYMYDIELITPTVEYIGEELYSTVDILGFYEGSIVASGTQENTTEVTCAYDPNDKQVFPNGHTDDHLILQETHLEYLIRFQNTGNAPAFDVLLRDTIDDNLDMSTFTLMANSHSVMTSLNEETREVTFFFENILLPDSAADEPGSHGLASYKIRPYPNLEVGTQITNTAYIFFDNNPPVVTNTTWSTIHECTEDHVLTMATEVDCPGLNTTVSSAYVSNPGWQEFFNWEIDGIQVGSDEVLSLGPDFITVDGVLALTVSNPLCDRNRQLHHL